DGVGCGQHRHDDLGLADRVGRAVGYARVLDLLGLLSCPIPHEDLMFRCDDVPCQRSAHDPRPDDRDTHTDSSFLRTPQAPPVRLPSIPVRVGLLSPYSYTYPSGVLAHIEALAAELERRGHDVRVLSPVDPHDRLTRVLHRGVASARRELPDNLVPLGRTLSLGANGAISTLAFTATTTRVLGHELRDGGYDVLHVHEPNASLAPWFAVENAPMPVVGTFHAYATKPVPMAVGNLVGQRRPMNKLSVRIADSDAARWTGDRKNTRLNSSHSQS